MAIVVAIAIAVALAAALVARDDNSRFRLQWELPVAAAGADAAAT